jgi:hypothetical protein
MNWEAIGALGEITGAAAVVITLVYLAAQVRAGNRALRTSVRDSVFRQIQDWNNQLVADEELPLLFHTGLGDLEALSDKERARFLHIAYSFIKLYENLYLHHKDGSLDDATWHGTKAVFSVYMLRPGLQHYWEQRRAFFNPDFGRMVDALESIETKAGAEVVGITLPDSPTGSG